MDDKEALAALTAVVQKGAIVDKALGDGMAVAKVLGAAKTIIGLLQQKMSARTGLEGIVLRVRQEEQKLKMAASGYSERVAKAQCRGGKGPRCHCRGAKEAGGRCQCNAAQHPGEGAGFRGA